MRTLKIGLLASLLSCLCACALNSDDVELSVGSGVVVNPQETRSKGVLVIEAEVYPGECPIVLLVGDYELGDWNQDMTVKREIRELGAENLPVSWMEDCE